MVSTFFASFRGSRSFPIVTRLVGTPIIIMPVFVAPNRDGLSVSATLFLFLLFGIFLSFLDIFMANCILFHLLKVICNLLLYRYRYSWKPCIKPLEFVQKLFDHLSDCDFFSSTSFDVNYIRNWAEALQDTESESYSSFDLLFFRQNNWSDQSRNI